MWRWGDLTLSNRFSRCITGEEGSEPLLEAIGDRPSARCCALRAQLILIRVAEAIAGSQPLHEAGVPPMVQGWLLEADEAATQAVNLAMNYAVLTLRGHIRILLGLNSEANMDFQKADDLPEATKVREAKNLQKSALKLLEKQEWRRGLKMLRRAARNNRYDRSLGVLVDVARALEKVDEIVRLCRKTRIVNIGRARVRYCEYSVARMVRTANQIHGAHRHHLFDGPRADRIGTAWARMADELKVVIADQRKTETTGGDFDRRLDVSHRRLDAAIGGLSGK